MRRTVVAPALSLCLLLLATIPVAAVGTGAGAGAQDGVMITYVDANTGGTARLVARDGALWCDWDAPATGFVDFLPSKYFSKCYVQNADGGPSIGCMSDSLDGSGGAVGSCRIATFLPSVNLRWWMGVMAADIRVVTTTHTEDSSTHVSAWKVEGSLGPSFDLGLDFVGPVPIPHGSIGAKASIGGSYSSSSTTYHSISTTREVSEKDALTLSIAGLYVQTVPEVEQLGWSGSTWGCDALDMVEMFLGPRQIGDYSNTVKAKALSGQLVTDLSHTRFGEVTNQGDFRTVVQLPHGFKATWGDDASEASTGVTNGLFLLTGADGGGTGTPTFDSAIAFTADYEYPEGEVIEEVPLKDPATLEYLMTVSLQPMKEGVLARVLEAPIGGIKYPVFVLDPTALEEHAWDLATAIVQTATDGAVGSAVVDADCPPTGVPANMNPQAWTATATVEGVGGADSRTSPLGVDVYLDLSPY